MPRYSVHLYYSSYVEVEVVAPDEDEAIEVAHDTANPNFAAEIMSNLESWSDADEVREVET